VHDHYYSLDTATTVVGCYNDAGTRALRKNGGSKSVADCWEYCSYLNYEYWAVQNGMECRCDNNYNHVTQYGLNTG